MKKHRIDDMQIVKDKAFIVRMMSAQFCRSAGMPREDMEQECFCALFRLARKLEAQGNIQRFDQLVRIVIRHHAYNLIQKNNTEVMKLIKRSTNEVGKLMQEGFSKYSVVMDELIYNDRLDNVRRLLIETDEDDGGNNLDSVIKEKALVMFEEILSPSKELTDELCSSSRMNNRWYFIACLKKVCHIRRMGDAKLCIAHIQTVCRTAFMDVS